MQLLGWVHCSARSALYLGDTWVNLENLLLRRCPCWPSISCVLVITFSQETLFPSPLGSVFLTLSLEPLCHLLWDYVDFTSFFFLLSLYVSFLVLKLVVALSALSFCNLDCHGHHLYYFITYYSCSLAISLSPLRLQDITSGSMCFSRT